MFGIITTLSGSLTCTIFREKKLVNLQKKNLPKEELVGTINYPDFLVLGHPKQNIQIIVPP